MSDRDFEFRIEPWSVKKENKEYETPIFNLLKRRMYLEAEGRTWEGDFYALQAPDWINVIPVTPQGEVVLVEQFRYGLLQPTLEIPGGMIDPGEEAGEAALRELREETGYEADEMVSLGRVSSNPAILTNFAHLFLAKGCRHVGGYNPDTDERINVHRVPRERFIAMAREGTIHHCIVMAAVARLLLYEAEQGVL